MPATSGRAALAFLEKRLPDLIVLDIHMEGMDGLELCRRIKENRQTSEIPVIFVTAETAPEVITAGFDAGCCDYVPKPFGTRRVSCAYFGASAHCAAEQGTSYGV